MENFYTKVIHDAIQLLLAKQFKRTIVLCDFLLDKGFRTAELIVIISYAYKIVEGSRKALEVLEQLTSNSQNNSQGFLKSPLIDLARVQYHIEIEKYQNALQSLQSFDDCTTSQDQNQSSIVTILKSLQQNYSSFRLQSEGNNRAITNYSKSSPCSSSNIVQSFRIKINQVTEAYMMARRGSDEGNQLEPSQHAVRYGEFYLQYDEIKQKMLAILSDEFKVDSQSIFNVKTGKKGKLLNQTGKKLKKHKSKQFFFKQSRPVTGSRDKKTLNRSLDGNQTNIIDKQKRQEMPKAQVEELQILLVQVNRFIGFFKNRLKNYGASRIQSMSPLKIRQIEQGENN